LGVKSVE
jgi:hypothetical protein